MKSTFLPKFGRKKKKNTGFFWEGGKVQAQPAPTVCPDTEAFPALSVMTCTHVLGKATQKRLAADAVKKEGSLFLAALFIRLELPPNHWVDAEMKGVN